jgi:hypothetical protein
MSHETLKWNLFPFYLTGIAKKWYAQTVRGVKGDWEVLQNKFCLAFFPEFRLVDLCMEVLGFRQKEKETLAQPGHDFWTYTCPVPTSNSPNQCFYSIFVKALARNPPSLSIFLREVLSLI